MTLQWLKSGTAEREYKNCFQLAINKLAGTTKSRYNYYRHDVFSILFKLDLLTNISAFNKSY